MENDPAEVYRNYADGLWGIEPAGWSYRDERAGWGVRDGACGVLTNELPCRDQHYLVRANLRETGTATASVNDTSSRFHTHRLTAGAPTTYTS